MAEPKVDLASFSLFRATPAQVVEFRRQRWPYMGDTVSLTEYIARDEKLEEMEHATEGKLILW
jgi:hypothetical protein